ncbi:hypothetical protein Ahy_A02g009288 [Arachis hypogaea]|uniref:Uncharacterized protein n=1 Tax=Arachis hypogaea TaxID=3818 RepID=A0A445EGK9_ARAHY|nr:hypothetical protein Ahy_A02g009288 [Arachis hypogaea]
MSFLLPTTVNKVSLVHLPPIIDLGAILEYNWGGHVLNFLIKGIRQHIVKKKYVVNGCLFALMIVYFHESTYKNKLADAIFGPPWVQHWTRKLLVKRIQAEIKQDMSTCQKQLKQRKKVEKKKKKSMIVAESEYDFENDLEDAQKTRKQPRRAAKKKMESEKKKHIYEDSSFEKESESNNSEESEKIRKQRRKIHKSAKKMQEKFTNLPKTGFTLPKLTMILQTQYHLQIWQVNMMMCSKHRQAFRAVCIGFSVFMLKEQDESLNEAAPISTSNMCTSIRNNSLKPHAGLMMVTKATSFLKHDIPASSSSLSFSELS